MPIARKIPKPAGRFWLCSAIRTKYDNTINRHYPAWFPHCYYLTFSSLCHCAIYVIARLDRAIPCRRLHSFGYSGQAGAWLGGITISFSDIFPFLLLPDLIGQSVCGCGCLVLGYSGQAGVWQGKKGAGAWQNQKGNNSGKKPEYEVIYAFGIFNLQNKNYLLR